MNATTTSAATEREFRRALQYQLAIGETLRYGAAQITRRPNQLVLVLDGTLYKIAAVNYAAACAHTMAIVCEGTALPTPSPTPSRQRRPRCGYCGVSRSASRSHPYRADISIGGKKKYIGIFATAVEAARAYDAYIRREGLDKPLNFPDEQEAIA